MYIFQPIDALKFPLCEFQTIIMNSFAVLVVQNQYFCFYITVIDSESFCFVCLFLSLQVIYLPPLPHPQKSINLCAAVHQTTDF